MASATKLVGVVPAPPGQVANVVNPPTKTGSNIALHTVMLFLVTLCVGIRLYTRQYITRQLGLDDYLCVLAFGLIVTYAALLLACGEYTLGHHLWDITFPNFVRGNKLEVVAECIYSILSATIKLSCLIFYRRIFAPSPFMRQLIYAGILFVLAAYTALLITNILDCIPVEKHYNPTVHGRCLPPGSTAYSSGAINVFSDIYVVFLPLPAVWRLNLKLSKRLKIMAVFALGIIVIAMSITRLAKTPLVFKEKDSTWSLSNFAIYSILELDIGMICACLLAFPAFINRYGPPFMSHLRSYADFWRSTPHGTSRSTEEAKPRGNSKIFNQGRDEYAKLAGGTSGLMMNEIPLQKTESSGDSSHRDQLEHAEISQSLQSPQPVASAHIV